MNNAHRIVLLMPLIATLFAARIGECHAFTVIGGDQWKQKFENPQTVRVRFQGRASVIGVGGVSIGSVSSLATNDYNPVCGEEWLYTEPGYINLRPWQVTPIYIGGTNVHQITVTDISVPNAAPKLGSGGDSGPPQQNYRVYIYRTNVLSRVYNTVSQSWDDLYGPGWEPFCEGSQQASWNCEADNEGNCCVWMSRSFWIQVRPDGVLHPAVSGEPSEDQNPWNGDNMPVDAPKAPGDEYPLTMSAGNGPTPQMTSLEWAVDLGRLWNGASAGKLRFIANRAGTNFCTIDTNTYTPLSLSYSSRSFDTNEVRVRKFLTNSAWIQQIKTPQTVMNVNPVTSNSFDLKFYTPSFITGQDTNGFYLLTNTAVPFVVWQFDTPNGTTNQLRIREVRNGQTNATTLGYSSSVWSLTNGTGSEARIQTRTISTNITGGATNRIETLEVKTSGGVISDKTVEAYRDFGWGYVIVGVTNDPAGANLVTSFTYGTDTNSFDYGQMTFISYPDGFWEQRVYVDEYISWQTALPPGLLFRIINPWKNSTTNSALEDNLITQLNYYDNKTYSLVKWRDSAFFSDIVENEYSPFWAVVYGEFNWNEEDSCGTVFLTTQGKRTGEVGTSPDEGTQDDVASYFGPQYGRLAGQIYDQWNELRIHDAYEYRFGEWRSSSNVFILGSVTNDVKQITYHGSFDTGDDPLTGGESGLTIEVWIKPYRSTKEVKIFDDGYLAAHETYVYTGQLTNFALIDKVVYRRDSLGHATNVFRIDPATSQTRTIYKADWQGTNTWPGDLLLSQTDETGTTNLFAYDSLKRTVTTTKVGAAAAGYPAQSNIVTSVTYDAAGRARTNSVSAGGMALRTLTSYDLSGRVTSVVSPDNLTNIYSYANGGRQTTVTLSSGATVTNLNYLDRRPASITGTAVTNQFFDYFYNDWRITNHPGMTQDDGFAFIPQNVTLITEGFTNSLRQIKQINDRRGVPTEVRRPGFRSTNEFSNFTLRFWDRLPDAVFETGFEDGEGGLGDVQTWFEKDYFGFTTLQSLAADQTQPWNEPASINRMASNVWNYATNVSGHWFKVSNQNGLLSDTNASLTVLQTVKQRLTGFLSNEISQSLTYDANTNLTDVKVTVDLANQKVTTVTDTPESTLSATNVVVNGLLQTESTPSVSAPVWHYYDALGRETAVKDSLGFTASKAYHATTSQVTSQTDRFGQTTTYSYYSPGGANAGLLYSETGPTGKKTYLKYNDRGQLIQKWGDVPYPEQRLYSAYGEMTNLVTYRAGSGWTGSSWPTNTTGTGDVTAWFFDGPTGLLTNKTDAASKTVGYSYYNNHVLKTRTWARNVTSTNLYNEVKDLVGINYTDGTTSLIYTNHDRRGLPRTITDATGIRGLKYDSFGRIANDGWTNGTFNGLSVSNHFHQVFGRDYLKFVTASTNLQHNYNSDAYGRMSNVTFGALSATYGYLANSDLLQTTTFKTNTMTSLTTTRAWEYGGRLRAIASATSTATVNVYSHDYDALQRRTRATWSDGSAWVYDYNDRDELTSAKRYWADFDPVFGQHYEYAFDSIGNRTINRFGGDAVGGNLRSLTNTANNLNQYTTRTVPGYLEVVGAVQATASSVTVNGSTADNRKVEYFAEELSVTNGSSPVWQGITAIATLGGNSTTNTGSVLVPPATQTFSYDLDGNLTNDSVWVYKWDAENRLTQMTNLTTVSTSARKKLVFTYDHLGRRATKKVYLWASTDYSANPATDERFIYDGWNQIAQISATNNTPIRTYMWGADLSGDLDGAGGIGGLLLVSDHQAGAYHFTTHDGNGNVTSLVKSDGTSSANYEFDPFGQSIRVTGAVAKVSPFRFSTKFTDDETDLVYFGYRYHHPSLGRWINRDPIAEDGGINIYVYVLNCPTRLHDPLGATAGTLEDEEGAVGGAAMIAGFGGAAIAAITLSNMRQSAAMWNAGQVLIASMATTDANDDWEQDLLDLNIAFSGQLVNNIPDPDDNGKKKGIRRSSKGGNNQAQNQITDKAATEARLNPEGREMLKRWVESISRGGEKSPSYQDILKAAKELANSAKYRI